MMKIAFVTCLFAAIACKQISGETDAEDRFNDLSNRGEAYEENRASYKTNVFGVEDDLFPSDGERIGMLSKRSVDVEAGGNDDTREKDNVRRSGGGCTVQPFDFKFSFSGNFRDNATGGCGTSVKTCDDPNGANIFDVEYSIKGDVANKVAGSQQFNAANTLKQVQAFLKNFKSRGKTPFYLYLNLLQKFDIGFDVSGSLAGSDSSCTQFSRCSASSGVASNKIPELNLSKLLQYLLFGVGMNNVLNTPIYLYINLLSAFKVELSLIGGIQGSGKNVESTICITITSTNKGAGSGRSFIFHLPLYLPDTFLADLTLNANVKGNQS